MRNQMTARKQFNVLVGHTFEIPSGFVYAVLNFPINIHHASVFQMAPLCEDSLFILWSAKANVENVNGFLSTNQSETGKQSYPLTMSGLEWHSVYHGYTIGKNWDDRPHHSV